MAPSIGRNGNYITLWTSEFGKVDLIASRDMIIAIPIYRYQLERLVAFFCFRNYRSGSIAASP